LFFTDKPAVSAAGRPPTRWANTSVPAWPKVQGLNGTSDEEQVLVGFFAGLGGHRRKASRPCARPVAGENGGAAPRQDFTG